METLKKIVSNQYFPAAAVLTAVVLFWAVGLLGGLSLLNNNQPPLTTLTWMLFVYVAAVLTPLAGGLAAVDLVRRWNRSRSAGAAGVHEASGVEPEAEYIAAEATVTEPVTQQPAPQAPAIHQQQPAPKKPIQKKPIQKKSGSKKAA
ncbi:MAG: hypothetical protein ABWY04_09180 [Arthrobacter sp.]